MKYAEGWKPFFDRQEANLTRTLKTLEEKADQMQVLPQRKQIFRMFRLIPFERVRVVLMGQDPYPTWCPLTSIPYASGVAFMPSEGTQKKPKTVIELETELCRDLGERTAQTIDFAKWIHQGVFLTNVALTVGTRCEGHLVNHRVLWELFSREFLQCLSDRGHVVFCFMGAEAWKLAEEVGSKTCRVVKVPHPVARSGEFQGCSVYSKVNRELAALGARPITWSRRPPAGPPAWA